MDLKELKKAWDQYSSKDKGKELDESQIREMLRGRTRSLIEKIERNIRIGYGIILVLIIVFLSDDFFITPQLVDGMTDGLEVPNWILFLDIFTNILIVTTFIFFVIRYYRVKKECDINCELSQTLRKTIHTLGLYQRMFYFAIITLVLSTATGFMVGLYQGITYGAKAQGMSFSDIGTGDLIIIFLIGIVIMVLLAGGLFLLFRWGFKRLYGNYLKKLKATLKELEEIN